MPENRRQAPVAIFLSAMSGGGAERAMLNLANRFAELEQPVDMVLGRREGPYLNQLDPRVRVIDLGVTRMLKALPALNAYMRRERPAALMPALAHTHIVSLVGKKLYRWPSRLVLSIQNTPSASAGIAPRWIERNWPIFVKALYGGADDTVAISQGVAEDIRRLTGGKASPHVIHNPVVTPSFFRQLEEEATHPWFRDKSVPVILAAGRLTNQKDYPTMLEAFARLLARRPARLIILGEGELKDELVALCSSLSISDHVAFAGFASNPYSLMKAANLFVLSSRWEGLANVIAESLACGTPVVSTDCPSGPSEILAGGKYGRLVPVGDPAALADAIQASLESPPDKALLARRGADFAVENIAQHYLDILLPNG
ncbi:MAG: glycosyl transferase [Alphaproteobacteria bacterium HGW-Alphaproteobacteria-3]|jgi:glycosyltransferase involved in cell wall biosynthesis|nr:MAG: glycosyl transferase [Alphaproteobacteria bacterium HGW-Alphaproteobacteria-3]